MRLSTIASMLLAATPSLVSAAGMLGFALGMVNPDNSCKQQSDYEADFDAIAANTAARVVRGYAASQCNTAQNILPAAKAKGFQVALGVWPDTDDSYNADKAAITTYAPQYQDVVYAITVGSETLYRGNFTGQQLLAKIQDMKSAVPWAKVGTADSWNKYADGTADPVIQGNPDILLVNAFGYWQGDDIGNATHQYFDDLMQAYQHIQSVAGNSNIELWNGETGWPTDGKNSSIDADTDTGLCSVAVVNGTLMCIDEGGTNYENAIAGTANAATYWSQGVCGMLDWGFNVFYFEAFDEPSKPPSVGDNGQAEDEAHWGAMTSGRQTKFSMGC